MPTVLEVTLNLLRRLKLTTLIGNPGSTEETFLKNFPKDFNYILALQEASVIGIADGLAQGLKQPVIVNIHTAAGMGNAMGCLITAYLNKTPLIVTAGQQTREMLLIEPFLTNVEAETLPKPWVKWSYEPKRPEDVPAAFMRAYATAVQPPQGPVFLSLPLDDWDKEIKHDDCYRTVSTKNAPELERLDEFANLINQSKNPVLIYGGDVARSNAWDLGVTFAEKLNAPVWLAPFAERVPFPEDHPLFAGMLPAAIAPLSEKLKDHDLLIVIGAPVFRYYPWVPGDYLPAGAKLLHITDNPYEAAKAAVGESLISDAGLALAALHKMIKARKPRAQAKKAASKKTIDENKVKYPLTAEEVFGILSEDLPEDYILVQESPSNVKELSNSRLGIICKADSYYSMSSGGLGWDLPAAVGLALAEKQTQRNRPVILIIGDGSFQYSPQALWTAVQHGLHLVVVVLRNEEYGILKSFALLEETPNVPGLDLPNLDIVSLSKGYSAESHQAEKIADIRGLFQQALQKKQTTVLVIPMDKTIKELIR